MAIVIMEMTPYHISGCAALERGCFTEAWSERMLEDECNNQLAHYFTVMDGLFVCGYGGYLSICGEGEITRLAVAESYRRKGFGRMILNEIIKSARALNISEITLEVRAGNAPARALYSNVGFREISKRPGYYQNPAEDALVMALTL
jgi:ribosomal-protein-alanine N-acetyltransferase